MTSLCLASYISWQRGTSRICCCASCVARLLLLSAAWAAIDRYLLFTGPTTATRSSGVRQASGKTDGQTNGRTPYRYIYPVPHTMRAVRIMSIIARFLCAPRATLWPITWYAWCWHWPTSPTWCTERWASRLIGQENAINVIRIWLT